MGAKPAAFKSSGANELFHELLLGELDQRRAASLLRNRRVIEPIDAVHVRIGGKTCVNFGSNNYLGLTYHPKVIAAMKDVLDRAGTGSGAAPLISGHSDFHDRAERAIATWKQMPAAVLLSSGYQAAHAAVQTISSLARKAPGGGRILIDKLAHASLIDAARASELELRVFPHNNFAKLQRLLESAPPDQLQFVITESIFSMDGDAADLPVLAELKSRHPFVLLLDEAHASGVYGPGGAGLARELDLTGVVDISLITLSKAVGVVGGAVCGSLEFCNALVNFGRAYLYSTAMPPHIAAGVSASIDVMKNEPQRQSRVRASALRVRSELRSMGVAEGDCPIIPIVLGDAEAAIAASERLLEEGLLVVAVRPPTVPNGTSRLRVTISSEHSEEDLKRLVSAIKQLGRAGLAT